MAIALYLGAEAHGGEAGTPPPSSVTALLLVVYNPSFDSL
jgi:hypothetical protein